MNANTNYGSDNVGVAYKTDLMLLLNTNAAVD